MKRKAFTLIELLVGITLSLLLMMSVGIFVSSGMKNINLQKKILDDNKEVSLNFLKLQKIIKKSTKLVTSFSDGVLLKNQPFFDKGGYSYIGVKEIDKEYCQAGEETRTDHVYINQFLPFEEEGEDINLSFSDILQSTGVTVGGVIYKSDIQKNQIINANTNEVVVGKDIFGEAFSDGSVGTGVFLNSPTGVEAVEGRLVFSDTLNNRILYLSGGLVYSLLNESDGLNEPTGLAYDSVDRKLYVANSGSGEILEFSSENFGTNPELNIAFDPESNFVADRFSIEIFTGSISLTTPDNINNFVFSGNIGFDTDDFQQTMNNKMDYYFINNYFSESVRPACSGPGKILDGTDVVNCTMSGTGQLANYSTKNFNSGTSYDITVNNISPNFIGNQNYYVKLSLFDGVSLEYEQYFSYFVQSDDDIFTRDDNTLKVFASGLEYPTGIDISGSDLLVNVFETREKKRINMSNGTINNNGSLTAFSQNSFGDYQGSTVLNNPVKYIDINLIGNFLNFKLGYYKYLTCFNLDEVVEKTFLLKKSF